MTIEVAGYMTLITTTIATLIAISHFRRRERGIEYVFSASALLSYALATGYGSALILIGGDVADEYLRQVGWFFVVQLNRAELVDLVVLHVTWIGLIAILPYCIPREIKTGRIQVSSFEFDHYRTAVRLAAIVALPAAIVIVVFSEDVIAFHTGSFWSFGNYSAMMAVRSGLLAQYSPYSLMLAFRVVPLFAVAILLLTSKAVVSVHTAAMRRRVLSLMFISLLLLLFCSAFVYSVGMKLQIVDFIAWIIFGRAILGMKFNWKLAFASAGVVLLLVSYQFYNANVLFESFAVEMFHFVGRTGASPFLYALVFADRANRVGLFGFAGIGVGTDATPAAEVVKVLAPGLGGHFVASVPYEGYGGMGFAGAFFYSCIVFGLIALCAVIARSRSGWIAALAAVTGCAISISSGYSGWGTINTGSFGLAPMVYMLSAMVVARHVVAKVQQ